MFKPVSDSCVLFPIMDYQCRCHMCEQAPEDGTWTEWRILLSSTISFWDLLTLPGYHLDAHSNVWTCTCTPCYSHFVRRFEGRWVKCYWCDWWTSKPHILNCVKGHPLCDRCYDWCLWCGGPYEPRRAVLQKVHQIRAVLCNVFGGNDPVYYGISKFLVEWYKP